jgi:hypothetical protein
MLTAAIRVLPMSDGMILQSPRDDLRSLYAINWPMRGKEERKSSRREGQGLTTLALRFARVTVSTAR